MAILPTRSSADSNSSADINALSTRAVDVNDINAKGDILAGTADNTISRLAVGSNDQVLTADSAEATGMKWAAASGSQGTVSAKSADYIVLDGDGIGYILMTTSTTDRTATLPTLADNQDRIITIKKVDSAAGTCTIDGEGAETIDGVTTKILTGQDEYITVIGTTSHWHVIAGTYTVNGMLYHQNQLTAASALTAAYSTLLSWTPTEDGLWSISPTLVCSSGAASTRLVFVSLFVDAVEKCEFISNLAYQSSTTYSNANGSYIVAATTAQTLYMKGYSTTSGINAAGHASIYETGWNITKIGQA